MPDGYAQVLYRRSLAHLCTAPCRGVEPKPRTAGTLPQLLGEEHEYRAPSSGCRCASAPP
ncbi:hypothetical protein [Streptomyces sp. NPDC091217]|uniref:hypothetical protein n=1 Tax=Streptomyces sp. NPDC091217 TaxID=3365975 RepID=UPI0037F79A7F